MDSIDHGTVTREYGELRGHVEVEYLDRHGSGRDWELVIDVTCEDGPIFIKRMELTDGELQVVVGRRW